MSDLFSNEAVRKKLTEFNVPSEDIETADIVKAERLSPDSEAVAILSYGEKDRNYVLYIEDFVDSLGYIKKQITTWYPCEVMEFIEPKKRVRFELTPGAQYYMNPDMDEVEKWIKYAVPDGHDFAFLAVIKPTKENTSYWAT